MDSVHGVAATVRKVPIDELVKDLQKLHERDLESIETPLEVLRANPVDPESLRQYLFWNNQHYTRNLID